MSTYVLLMGCNASNARDTTSHLTLKPDFGSGQVETSYKQVQLVYFRI